MKRAAIMGMVVLLCACGARTVERATDTLKVAHGATNAARSAFVEWDSVHQAALVERATSAEVATATLAAYRLKRAAVIRSFAIAYSSIAAAATLIPLVESGKRSEAELLVMVLDAATAAKQLAREIAAFREEL